MPPDHRDGSAEASSPGLGDGSLPLESPDQLDPAGVEPGDPPSESAAPSPTTPQPHDPAATVGWCSMPRCGAPFASWVDYVHHYMTKHAGGDRLNLCALCLERVQGDGPQHQKAHRTSSFRCGLCTATFLSRVLVGKHENAFHRERPGEGAAASLAYAKVAAVAAAASPRISSSTAMTSSPRTSSSTAVTSSFSTAMTLPPSAAFPGTSSTATAVPSTTSSAVMTSSTRTLPPTRMSSTRTSSNSTATSPARTSSAKKTPSATVMTSLSRTSPSTMTSSAGSVVVTSASGVALSVATDMVASTSIISTASSSPSASPMPPAVTGEPVIVPAAVSAPSSGGRTSSATRPTKPSSSSSLPWPWGSHGVHDGGGVPTGWCSFPGCRRPFSRWESQVQHFREAHAHTLKRPEFVCPKCLAYCNADHDYNAHQKHHRRAHRQRHVCPVCGAEVLREKLIHSHLERFHKFSKVNSEVPNAGKRGKAS